MRKFHPIEPAIVLQDVPAEQEITRSTIRRRTNVSNAVSVHGTDDDFSMTECMQPQDQPPELSMSGNLAEPQCSVNDLPINGNYRIETEQTSIDLPATPNVAWSTGALDNQPLGQYHPSVLDSLSTTPFWLSLDQTSISLKEAGPRTDCDASDAPESIDPQVVRDLDQPSSISVTGHGATDPVDSLSLNGLAQDNSVVGVFAAKLQGFLLAQNPPAAFANLSRHKIKRFNDAYFNHFDVHAPFIHRATFNLSQASSKPLFVTVAPS